MMQESTALYIETIINKMVTVDNHEVYDKRYKDPVNFPLYTKIPCCIYFYYIAFTADGCPDIRHYTHDNGTAGIEPFEIRSFIMSLARNARRKGPSPEMDGRDFRDITWVRKSYVVVFMDSPYWTLFKRTNGKGGVVFNTLRGSTDNHSFFDGDDLQIDMSPAQDGTTDMRSAIYFINHLTKDDIGTDLTYDANGQPATEDFVFDVFFDVKGESGGSTCFVIDPDGTNMGPPVPPPA
jgi:hypothetical protein